jgi:glycosyltransferase involved in cell wall biosynthesis
MPAAGPHPLRVLHCPTSVGGNPPALAAAERELGLASVAVTFEPTAHAHEIDEVLFTGAGKARRELRRWHLLLRALREFDVVHFNFGSSIAPRRYPSAWSGGPGLARTLHSLYTRLVELRDVPLLKRAGKAIFVTYQGDDARPGAPELDELKRRSISVFDRYADGIFALNPDLLRVLPARAQFLPYASVDPRRWKPSDTPRQEPKPLRVVHAPSDREIKGTDALVEAVEQLRRDGHTIELILVEGLPHARVRALYEQADLAVDQLRIGWYGGFAVELMALGKPVVCHVRAGDLRYLPAEMRDELPLIEATPQTIYDVLRAWLVERADELPTLGRRGRAFVERWHDPLRIAARLSQAYEAAVLRARGDA